MRCPILRDYGYDGLSRLLTANYSIGADYTYGYDVAGNLVNNNGVTRTYNAANQMVDDGTNTLTYDANGNLTNDGVNAYTWDRANRMLTAPNSTSYKYDGLSNRIQQTVSSVVTDYLNDVQPGLVKLLRQDDGTNVAHFVHAPRGIHSMDDGTDWTWYAQDGLGSVRGLVDASADVVSSQSYNPYGVPDGSYGAGFGFTGEQTDANDLLYLRARYFAPEMGVFTALDPFEGIVDRTMSLNGYSWVEGNVLNAVDPSGECIDGIIWALIPPIIAQTATATPTLYPPTPTPALIPSHITAKIRAVSVIIEAIGAIDGGHLNSLGTLVESRMGVGLLTHTHYITYSSPTNQLTLNFDTNTDVILPPRYNPADTSQFELVNTYALYVDLIRSDYVFNLTGFLNNASIDLGSGDWGLGEYSDEQSRLHLVPNGYSTLNTNPLSNVGVALTANELLSAETVRRMYPNANIYLAFNNLAGGVNAVMASSPISELFPASGKFILDVYAVPIPTTYTPGAWSGGGVFADIGGELKLIGVTTAGNPFQGLSIIQFVSI